MVNSAGFLLLHPSPPVPAISIPLHHSFVHLFVHCISAEHLLHASHLAYCRRKMVDNVASLFSRNEAKQPKLKPALLVLGAANITSVLTLHNPKLPFVHQSGKSSLPQHFLSPKMPQVSPEYLLFQKDYILWNALMSF